MTDALEDHAGTLRTGGRTINNLRFVGDIDGPTGKKHELWLDTPSKDYYMEISSEKSKRMTNNSNGITTDIKVQDKRRETVQRFKCFRQNIRA